MATRVYEPDILARILEGRLTNDQVAAVAKLAPNVEVPAFCRQAASAYEAPPEIWAGAFAIIKKRAASAT